MRLTAFLISFFSAFILIPFAIKRSYKKNLLDYPKENSVHTRPTPMIGGVCIFSVFFVLSLALRATYNLMPLFLASLPIILTGLYDDLKGLNAVRKIFVQFISAVILISFGISITKIRIPFGPIVEIANFSVPLTILWISFISNLINLLDGLDGLASGLCIILFSVLCIITNTGSISAQLLILMGATSAFLIFNFYPAKIFLGNNGSSFLGFAVGYFSLVTSQKSTVLPILVMPIGILLVQVFDVLYSIVRRTKRGAPIFKGDKGHVHHLMLNFIKNHRLTVLSFYLIAIILAALVLKIFTL